MSDVLLLAAMAEETRPVLHGREATELNVRRGRAWRLESDGLVVTVVTCGIGLVNSAAATALAIETYQPKYVISLGSAGGLGVDVRVGDIIVGDSYRYADADSRIFGYELGQIPTMPRTYPGDPGLLGLVRADGSDATVHVGEIVSGNSFVAGELAPVVRERFPEALAADMESTAIAQVAWGAKVPFLCVRSISDLCTPNADDEFKGNIDDVAQRSADAVWRLIARLPR
ncbi:MULTISPECIES: 5'-methylthioadenosine/S-adenosylhomocysteine nucleosidase [unclassified Luteococcus]|uniref:5'-methylthioadenosine/S-adenosylhomocysteine nucleosidase n=1 Tax=unclassified Luteococcus TaxID=2639923 RepID=UPI00313F18ED